MRKWAIGAVGLAMLAIAFTVRSDLHEIALGRKQISGHHQVVRPQMEVIREAPPVDFPAPSLVVTTTQQPPPQLPASQPPQQIVIQRGVQPSTPLLSGGIFRQ